MTRFLKVFLRDRLDGRIQVAGFGKHPAWADHIDDLGLTTESLAIAKSLLYLEGIASQLASGAWDRIESSGQAKEFDHRFVWGRDKQAIVGAIWASSDGKGRARFPMVICAQAEVAGDRAIALYLEPVERLGLQCKSVTTQEAVRDFHSRTCADLNVQTFPRSPTPARTALDNKDRSGDIILGALIGLANEIDRTARFGDPRGHFRVASVSTQVKKNLEFWSGYLERIVQLPHLVIAGEPGASTDLIIGEPEPKDFFCLRANDSVLPPLHSDAVRRPKLEAEAREYLQSCGVAFSAAPSRKGSWITSLFNKRP